MPTTIWLKPGILIIYGASLDAEKHKHHAIQLVWPALNTVCKYNGDEVLGPLIVNSKVEHQLQMEAGWVLLVEPKSEFGQQLSIRLGQCDVVSIEGVAPFCNGHSGPSEEFSENLSKGLSQELSNDPTVLLLPISKALGVTRIFTDAVSNVSDARIQQLLNSLNSCLPGDCLKPATWRASEVAASLHLSQSRFLHLFSEKMGITWRPYLLWHRMICAINAMLKGTSATDAAHMAGFSDSAHLSRTFRSLFGMSIREAQSLFPKR